MPITKERVGAIIIRDKKMLFGTGDGLNLFWTPGGRPDEGEELLIALARELVEELGVTLTSSEFYATFMEKNWADDSDLTCHYYLAEFSGEPTPSQEITEIRWATKEDILNGVVPVDEYAKGQLIPKLVSEGLL